MRTSNSFPHFTFSSHSLESRLDFISKHLSCSVICDHEKCAKIYDCRDCIIIFNSEVAQLEHSGDSRVSSGVEQRERAEREEQASTRRAKNAEIGGELDFSSPAKSVITHDTEIVYSGNLNFLFCFKLFHIFFCVFVSDLLLLWFPSPHTRHTQSWAFSCHIQQDLERDS